MLSETTLTAIRAVLYVALDKRDTPISPTEIAGRLGASPAYLSKINTSLVKNGVLRSHRGTRGGVTLATAPESITLLDIVEACQGKVLGDYCTEHDDLEQVCAFHAAMHRLQHEIVSTLRAWTMADMMARPLPCEELRDKVSCRLAGAAHETPEA